jgi:hypothetical protein
VNVLNVLLVWLPNVLKLCVTILVAPVIIAIMMRFMFHILCIPMCKLLYFRLFSASFLRDIPVSFIIIIILLLLLVVVVVNSVEA